MAGLHLVATSALPTHCPTQRELDDLELLLSGALAPISTFNTPSSPITLELSEELQTKWQEAGALDLIDPEGLPLARLETSGKLTALARPEFGPFRRLYLSPSEVRAQFPQHTFVPVSGPLTKGHFQQLSAISTPVVLLALVGEGTPELSPVALIQATVAAAHLLGNAAVVAVPLAAHGDAQVDHDLGWQVVLNYADSNSVVGLTDDDSGLPPDIEAIVRADQPALEEQGLVLFFTGLSGSGKSTLARALMDHLLESGLRSVTSLDGDVVRRNLSAGLSFSKADRETNIRRIGWVAAEITRHRGVAVCSPIAPFDETRQQVRAMVEAAGGAFFLVHVATPLEECERRDRKGLYAKARRGEIPDFTGISSPYEEPEDADVRVDTTGRTIDEALGDVITGLSEAGYVDLREQPMAPIRVLFVCTANICRSPFMELAAREFLQDNSSVQVTSAGTHAHAGKALDMGLMAQLDDPTAATNLSSRLLTRDLINEADLVLTAEASHRQVVLDEVPSAFRKVYTLGQFADAITKQPLTGRELLANLAQLQVDRSGQHDIADPFRQGERAAVEAANQIKPHIKAVMSHLTR
jgi:sulfate adenylyltransferase